MCTNLKGTKGCYVDSNKSFILQVTAPWPPYEESNEKGF